ncbi:MAG TPA: hypothetical protein VK607_18390, partial [Kofleriaceae bacterium]|nr:hypothetical protein [Kofleriaceae bacterium]
VYVVHAELKTPGGEPIGFEKVVLVKRGTDEVVAGPAITEGDGTISFIVPEQGSFDLKIVDDETHHHVTPPPDAEVAMQLHCQFFDGGVPAAGEVVQVSGDGSRMAVTLGQGGELDLAVSPGEYELTIRGQSFVAHPVTLADHGGYHTFDLPPRAEPPDDFEAARANRYSPSGDR